LSNISLDSKGVFRDVAVNVLRPKVMKQSRKWSAGVLAAGSLAMTLASGCGSGYHEASATMGAAITTSALFYSLDATDGLVLAFAPNSTGSATEAGTLKLPAGLTPNLIATDAQGNLYVGGYTTSVNTTEVVEYATGVTGDVVPMRTVMLDQGKLTALAVDAGGQIYAGQLNVLASVKIYAATANGVSTPLRTIDPAYLLFVNDIAVDSSGNTYVSAWNGGAYTIVEYGTTAAGGATSLRTLYAPAGSYFGGITVDDAGDIFAMEQLTIVKFAPGATGTPSPVQAINIPGPGSGYTVESYSNVLRRDSTGNFFVPTTLSLSSNATSSQNVVFAFASTASGNATPILQFSPQNATVSTPLGINIPLAVF